MSKKHESGEHTPVPPDLSLPSANLSEEVNNAIIQSEIEGGFLFKELKGPINLDVKTRNHTYEIRGLTAKGTCLIRGHEKYCPDFTPATIKGSTWGGSMLKEKFIGRGMDLEFKTEGHLNPITTTTIEEITER